MRKVQIEKFAKEKGADLVGCADVSLFPRGTDNPLNPRYYLPDAKSVWVMGLKLNDALWDKLTGTYDIHSTNLLSYLRHYNYDLLDFIAVQTARFIEDQGYDAYPVEARTETKVQMVYTGFFPFKEAARLAGMGDYGKSTLLITPEFGPRVRWVSLITNVKIDGGRTKKPVPRSDTDRVCGDCTVCMDQCPVKAIHYENGRPWVDQRKCQGYMDVAQNCALCQGVCVLGKEAAAKRRKKKRA